MSKLSNLKHKLHIKIELNFSIICDVSVYASPPTGHFSALVAIQLLRPYPVNHQVQGFVCHDPFSSSYGTKVKVDDRTQGELDTAL
jgi:hypothetical protein